MRRLFSGIMLALLIASILTASYKISRVMASGTIYIRADGSIDPPTAPILRDGDLYTLTSDITSDADGIVIERDYVTVDGGGYTVQGSGIGNGFSLFGTNNFTLENTNIQNFMNGTCLASSSNNTIIGNNITDTAIAIYLSSSSNNTLSRNNVTANTGYGVWGISSSYNNVSENSITTKDRIDSGIAFCLSSNNTMISNNITGNSGGLHLEGSSNCSIVGNSITANTVGIYFSESSNNSIIGNNLTSCWCAIGFVDSSWNSISENYVANNVNGTAIHRSSNNYVFGNIMTNNSEGISLSDSSDSNVLFENSIVNNSFGIRFLSREDFLPCSDNKLYHNSLANNTRQVEVSASSATATVWDDGYPSGGNYWSDYTGKDSDGDGIGDLAYFIDSNNQDNYPLMGPWTPEGESITVIPSSDVAITFESVTSTGITVLSKTQEGPDPPSGFKLATAETTYFSIETDASYSGRVRIGVSYDDSGLTLEEENALQLVHWNEASQLWEDITTSVDVANNVIYGETSSFSTFVAITKLIHDIGMAGAPASRTVVGQGLKVQLNMTVTDHGDYAETFNLTVYANSTVVATLTDVSLPGRSSASLSCSWNTSGFARAYIVSANVTKVEGEVDVFDNTFTLGTIKVSCMGDINGDYVTDAKDYQLVKKAIPSMPGNPKWNPNANMNDDSVIDAKDYQIVKSHIPSQLP